MVGSALKRSRLERGETRLQLGNKLFISASMVNEIESGRKAIPKDRRSEIARSVDDPAVYMEIAREVTGGVMTSPFLTNVDDHRMVGVLKFQEEVCEALGKLESILPILLRARCAAELRSGELDEIKEAMLEMIEATTAAENTLARLAKCYGISLAELFDKHQQDLVSKGYIEKEKDRF